MEEIDIKEILSFFLSKIYIVVIITFCCVVISMIYGLFLKTPMYRSSTTLVLAGSNIESSETTITQGEITLNQKLVSTYREIIKSRLILEQVIDNLNLNRSVESLSGGVTVTSESDTELIRITVSDKDANTAKNIANEIASVFSKEIVEIYNIKNCRVIDKAYTAVAPYNINFVKQLLITLVIAFLLSCIDIFILYYFDTTIKSTEDIERKICLPILGSIPDSQKRGGKRYEK